MNASDTQKTELAVQNLEPQPGTEKKLGFLSFGHWAEIPGSRVNSASDSLHQAIDLAVGAEDIGLDGALPRAPFRSAAGHPVPASVCYCR